MTAENVQADLDEARAELHEAQRIAALLDEDPQRTAGQRIAIVRAIIERDLAARRVEAWVRIVDQLRTEGGRLGLFA